MRIKFYKMQGCGNDYIFIDERQRIQIRGPSEVARQLSDRHFGIGSDGLILIRKSKVADARMIMFNADGSRAEMCGNGIRCVGRLIQSIDRLKRGDLSVETDAGIKRLYFKGPQIGVSMGRPSFQNRIKLLGRTYDCLSMGNPHAVTFVSNVEQLNIAKIGPRIECHPKFPKRTNVEFVQVIDRNTIRVRTWERGSGETLACGTGACAAAVISILKKRTRSPLHVIVNGGKLRIRWSAESVILEGPAIISFAGEITTPKSLPVKNKKGQE